MPTLTNYTNFLSAINGISVTGATTHYNYPPASIDISDGACTFVTMPNGDRGDLVFSCVNSGKSRSIGYVIIVDATGQGTQSQNYGKLAALMDAFETALDALTPGTFNFLDYTMSTTGNYPIGDSEYWAIVAEITVRSAR